MEYRLVLFLRNNHIFTSSYINECTRIYYDKMRIRVITQRSLKVNFAMVEWQQKVSYTVVMNIQSFESNHANFV